MVTHVALAAPDNELPLFEYSYIAPYTGTFISCSCGMIRRANTSSCRM